MASSTPVGDDSTSVPGTPDDRSDTQPLSPSVIPETPPSSPVDHEQKKNKRKRDDAVTPPPPHASASPSLSDLDDEDDSDNEREMKRTRSIIGTCGVDDCEQKATTVTRCDMCEYNDPACVGRACSICIVKVGKDGSYCPVCALRAINHYRAAKYYKKSYLAMFTQPDMKANIIVYSNTTEGDATLKAYHEYRLSHGLIMSPESRLAKYVRIIELTSSDTINEARSNAAWADLSVPSRT
jgi:hypothetical protein